MIELLVHHELPEVGIVYADDIIGNRYFIDADTRVPRPLTAGQVLAAEVTDEGYVLSAELKQDLVSRHITPADGNVFADLGFLADEAKAMLEEADADQLAQAKAALADKGRAIEVDIDDH